MNLFPFASSSLVKRLPLHTPRQDSIKKLLFVYGGLYGIYLYENGPTKNVTHRNLIASGESARLSLLLFHF
jgi:hypothetical protein